MKPAGKGRSGPAFDAGLLGEIAKEIDLYDVIEALSPGNSAVGREMDRAGRWLFNHRFGGGHLWWKEFTERPMGDWPEVAAHLAKDWFTPQGLPYAFDGRHLRETAYLRHFRHARASQSWGMLTGLDAIGGGSALMVAVQEARRPVTGYDGDVALMGDGCCIALNIAVGVSTCNPLLIVAGVVRATTLLRRWDSPLGYEGGSIYDIDIYDRLGCPCLLSPGTRRTKRERR